MGKRVEIQEVKAWGALAPEVGGRDVFCGCWADIEGLCSEGRHTQNSFRKTLLEATVTTAPIFAALRM